MSAITPATIQKVAHLARLSNNDLGEDELQKYSVQLESILHHFGSIQAIDTFGMATTDGWRTIKIEALRSDEPDSDLIQYSKVRHNILNNFPNRIGDLLALPGIFEES